MLAAVVIGRVIVAVIGDGLFQPGDGRIQVGVRGVEIHHQRPDLGAQEMVRARGAERRQRLQHGRAHEIQHRRLVVEMPHLVAVPGNQSPDHRHQSGRDGAAFGRLQRRAGLATECRLACATRLKPGGGLVDDLQRGQVAVLGVVRPGEQAVAFQHRAAHLRVFGRKLLQPQAQFIAGLLPGQPADFVAKDLGRQRARIDRGRDGDDRVGMDVIDVSFRHIGVQRRVDAGRPGVQRKGAMGQIAHHLVLMRDAAILALQRAQLVHVKRGEAVHAHGPDVAARSLDPQHLDLFAGQGVGLKHLGAGVAAAIVRHPLVRAQQVRAVKQLFRFAHPGGAGIVPQVFQPVGGHDLRHGFPP